MRLPTLVGRGGRAWEMLYNLKPTDPSDWGATLSSWFLNMPGAHPFWSWWLLSSIHLRPIEGCRPPVIRTPGASHEFLIIALNPKFPSPNVDQDVPETLHYLTPFDLEHQVVGIDDAQAKHITMLMVRACVDGRMSPDQDFRSRWQAMLNTTAEHYRTGRHSIS